MRNLETANGIEVTESFLTETIFNACRANESRNVFESADGFVVSFLLRADGDHIAVVRNKESEVIATATVDEFDN